MPEEVGKPIVVGTQMPSQLEFLSAATQPISRRRLIRSAKNPLDKCTVVSIFPKDVEAEKVTMEPGRFYIKAGTLEKPSILVVGTSSWWKDIDYEQPLQEIIVGSIQVANSIINDYCNAVFGSNMSDAMPGLFFTEGAKTVDEIKTNYKDKLKEVNQKQMRWYEILVRAADSLWARTNNNPIVIMDEMRLAARSLNLNDKAWLKDYQIAELIRCQFCGGMRNPQFPICPVCKAIDPKHPLAASIKFAV